MQDTLTPRQIAGAANGRLAAGTKSSEGRARSATNSTKHGLTCKPLDNPSDKAIDEPADRPTVILINESPDAYDALFESLASCFQPSDTHELTLVRRMAESEWLRQRALQLESAALSEAMRQQARPFAENSGASDLDPADAEPLRAWHAFSKLIARNPAFATLQRYASAHARAYSRSERELRDYRQARADNIHPVTTLEPIDVPTNRWQPLETITPSSDSGGETALGDCPAFGDCPPPTAPEQTPPPATQSNETQSNETQNYGTKVTPSPQSGLVNLPPLRLTGTINLP